MNRLNKIIEIVLFVLLLILGSILIGQGYTGLKSDKLIDKGFTYLPLVIIYFLVILIYAIFNVIKNKKRIIEFSIVFVIALILSLSTIGTLNNFNISVRYVFAIENIVLFIYSFKLLFNLINSYYKEENV